jgi:hypothetical protein
MLPFASSRLCRWEWDEGSDAAPQKAQRIKSAEDVWLIKLGTRFFVYVAG